MKIQQRLTRAKCNEPAIILCFYSLYCHRKKEAHWIPERAVHPLDADADAGLGLE